MDAKTYLSEILAYYKHKVDNNLCTMEEIESVSKTIQQNMEIYGTVEDIAKFYDVPETNVRSNINRCIIEKPKRRVYYRFLSFMKIAPKKWHK